MNENIKSKLSGLRGLSKSGRELTASDIRLLLDSIFDNGLGDVVSDVTGLGLDSNLFYGVNVLGSGLLGDKTIRLPNPPVKGRVVKIINNTGYVIYVRPSVVGGSINGVVDGSAGVPSDGKIYEFVCWENPLPGAWSWTPPATGQYDSGEIILSGLTSATRFAGFNSANFIADPSNLGSSSGWAYDGKNKAVQIPGVVGVSIPIYKGSLPLNAKKIKLYSNYVQNWGGAGFAVELGGAYQFSQGCFVNYYDKITGEYNPTISGPQSAGTYFSSSNITSQGVVAGSPLVSYGECSPNIGDPGTPFLAGEISSSFFQDSKFGDHYLGDQTVDGIVYERWFTRYICFHIMTEGFSPAQTLKLRFFIETN